VGELPVIPAGSMRESIRIEDSTQSTNSFGESIDVWSPFATRKADIAGKQLDEFVGGERIRTVGTHKVTMRYLAGLKTSMRIVWTSRTPNRILEIVNITEVNNREGHTLICKEQAT